MVLKLYVEYKVSKHLDVHGSLNFILSNFLSIKIILESGIELFLISERILQL